MDNGAPEGNSADLPAPRAWSDGTQWTIRPDLVVRSAEIVVEGDAPDWWGEVESVPIPIDEDRYVAAVEVREVNDVDTHNKDRQTVGGRYVWHHLIYRTQVGLDRTGEAADVDGAAGAADDVVGWPVHEVGRNPDYFDPKGARLLKKGSYIVSDSAHIHSNGRDTTSHLEFGYKFMPNLAAEIGYFDFGKVRASAPGINAELKNSAFGGGVAYHLELAPSWNAVGRLGLAQVKTKISGTVAGLGSASDTDNNTALYAGLGVGYKISKTLSVDGAWDLSKSKYNKNGVDESGNINMFSVGLTFGF